MKYLKKKKFNVLNIETYVVFNNVTDELLRFKKSLNVCMYMFKYRTRHYDLLIMRPTNDTSINLNESEELTKRITIIHVKIQCSLRLKRNSDSNHAYQVHLPMD